MDPSLPQYLVQRLLVTFLTSSLPPVRATPGSPVSAPPSCTVLLGHRPSSSLCVPSKHTGHCVSAYFPGFCASEFLAPSVTSPRGRLAVGVLLASGPEPSGKVSKQNSSLLCSTRDPSKEQWGEMSLASLEPSGNQRFRGHRWDSGSPPLPSQTGKQGPRKALQQIEGTWDGNPRQV